jgi:pimeloyl-ACP methyl ester carboxylesterase
MTADPPKGRLALPTLLAVSLALPLVAQVTTCPSSVPYGDNPLAGHSAMVNGITMYYETYGSGPPLLLVHGNGGSIFAMRCQIPYFSKSHLVIVADSRDHGKSANGVGPLTYDQIANDFSELLMQMNAAPADVIGWSDGAIVALLLGIHHPEQVRRLVADAPNLRPDPSALFPWVIDLIRRSRDNAAAKLDQGDHTQDWRRILRREQMMLDQPHISVDDLHAIRSPTLVMAGDTDMIVPEHLLEIYRNIPSANLYIAPGATHQLLHDDPELFNRVTSRFLDEPFRKPQPRQ